MKCDDQRPVCQRCVRASRQCEGYLDSTRDTATRRLPLKPNSISSYSIPFKVPGSQADRQLLHYYCCQAAWNLSSGSDPALWTHLVLQRSHDLPVIRNALVALSSLHKDFLCGELVGADFESSGPSAYANLAPVTTMSIISRCRRQLRNYLSRLDASPVVALICSVIFYTFESLLGEPQKAIWHLDRGLILLKQCQSDGSFEPDDPLIPHLTTLLYLLDIQASCFDDRRPPILKLASDAETLGLVDLVPDSFFDITHAEAVSTKLQNWILHHLNNHGTHSGETLQELSADSLREKLLLAVQLEKYERTLAKFTASQVRIPNIWPQKEADRRLLERSLLLRAHLHTFQYLIKETISVFALTPSNSSRIAGSQVSVKVSIENMDNDLDASLASISTLLFQSATPSAPDASASPPKSSRTYTLSTHVIGALYFLSLKSSNPRTLKNALALFLHPQVRDARDGLWDARTAAFVAENLAKVRSNGGVRQGSHERDILLHVADVEPGADLSKLDRIRSMSNGHQLPMMQSKSFTLILKHGRPSRQPELANARATGEAEGKEHVVVQERRPPSTAAPSHPQAECHPLQTSSTPEVSGRAACTLPLSSPHDPALASEPGPPSCDVQPAKHHRGLASDIFPLRLPTAPHHGKPLAGHYDDKVR